MKIKRAVIDRIESDKAVCELEDKTFVDVDLKLFDYSAEEGDHILIYPKTVKKDINYKREKINLDKYFKN